MKRTTLFITLLVLIVGCSKPEPINLEEMLIEREGHYFRKDTNKPYSGPVFSLYRDGQKKEEGILKKGYFDGKHIYWYENGQKKFEKNYSYSPKNELSYWKLDGEYTEWYSDGQKKEERTYKDGERDGLWISVWDDMRKTKREGTYIDGKLNGVVTTWWGGNKRSEITYKDGDWDGLQIYWFYMVNEKKTDIIWYKILEENWKDSKLHGLSTHWLEGEKTSVRNFKNGKLDGLYTWWYFNGPKKIEVNFKNGKKVGLLTKWDENGNLIETIDCDKVSCEEEVFKENGGPDYLLTKFYMVDEFSTR